jgi:GDP-L-fucose synthase
MVGNLLSQRVGNKAMTLLITGGNGFIAKNILEQLGKDYSIISRTSSELNLLDGEATCEYISKNKFDIIIHTATYDAAPRHSTKDPSKVLENNLKMFFNLVGFYQHL